MLITHTLNKYLSYQPAKKPDPSFFVSEFGLHPQAIFNRLKGEQKHFDSVTRIKMDNGSALEDATKKALFHNYRGTVTTQLPLFDSVWSGLADFVLDHLTPFPVIVEHKGVSDKWWGGYVPIKTTHVCQLWLYGQLYGKMYNVKPELRLFYRSWGGTCEVIISEVAEKTVRLVGEKDGSPLDFTLKIALEKLLDEVEIYCTTGQHPEIEMISTLKEDTWTYPEDRTSLWFPTG